MELAHDGIIDIATGLSVNSKKWTNRKWRWSELVNKLITERKTDETIKQYLAASKPERGRIKDVGGYIGGYVRGGRRTPKTNIMHRQLLTLDIDYASMDFWEDYDMIFDNAAVLHATHSHTEKEPRFRLIVPLDREVTPDEYIAIARRVAGNLDIEVFDNTTFQISRLMFWPSNPKDVEYYYEFMDGPFMCADEILDTYHDWKDSIEWPISIRHQHELQSLTSKQQDPLTKKGIVGAFCRSFTVAEAINEFLSDKYTECDIENRYTYVNGSTSSGLVTYDDIFAYSHHGSDPCSGKLCNVFDLVRLHLYGHLDTEANSKKSFKEMETMAIKNAEVKKTLALETFSESKYVFEDIEVEDYDEILDGEQAPTEVTEEDLDWMAKLEVNGKGEYLSSASNITAIFRQDKNLKNRFQLNNFDAKRYVCGSLPWRKVTPPDDMGNVDYSGIRNYLEIIYGITGTQKIDDALALEFDRNNFHPIRDYLNGLEWDGVKRVDKLLIDYFGADNNVYSKEAIRKTMVAAVARIFKPGCKFDLVLTLVGEEGNGKSSLVKKLGRGWSSDTFMTVHGKDSFEQLQGAWLIEMAELAGLRKAEVEAVKHFITKQEDSFRPAYARTSETFPRQCVFVGTTNNWNFLQSSTGNRRFMPIDTLPKEQLSKRMIDIKDSTVNQLWAEAVQLYRKGEPLFLSKEAEAIARKEQQQHSVIDERAGIVEKYLDTLLPSNWAKIGIEGRRMFFDDGDTGTEERQYVCVAEIWAECLGKDKNTMDRYKTREVNELLRGLKDWTPVKSPRTFPIYGKQKYYKREIL